MGVEITIDDNGTGVPEEERAAVFKRFTRGSTASRSGSGLGLALVAQQAELHGGTASLKASPLGGARLLLRLPGQRPHREEDRSNGPRFFSNEPRAGKTNGRGSGPPSILNG